MLNKLISLIKGEEFKLDKRLSSSFILGFLLTRLWSYIRFVFIFKTLKIGFLGRRSKVIRAKDIKFGKNLSIDRECFLNALSEQGMVLGDNVSIQKRVIIECSGSLKSLGKGLVIGNNVGIGTSCFLGCAGGIEIGDDTILGNNISFHSENHNFKNLDVPIRLQGVNRKGIKIGKNCWIGAKVTILDGSIVGEGCIIAAGAVLTGKSFPDNSIIGGVPAKIISTRTNYL